MYIVSEDSVFITSIEITECSVIESLGAKNIPQRELYTVAPLACIDSYWTCGT